jgi:hypothetical protein
MISLIILGLLILGFSDPLIRKGEDSKFKRIWIKVIKKPIFDSIMDFQQKLIKNVEKKYGKNPNTGMIDFNKIYDDFSKNYTNKIITFALILILIGFIGVIIQLILHFM